MRSHEHSPSDARWRISVRAANRPATPQAETALPDHPVPLERSRASCYTPKPDVETQLTPVDDWVHQEFASIDELLVGAGCNRREASGAGRVYRAPRRRAGRVALMHTAASAGTGGGKRERVKRDVLDQAPQRFRIAEVRLALPGISDGTIRNALDDLRDEGRVDVHGLGRGASWSRRV